MNDLTVSEFIEILKTFPQDWPICIGDKHAEECYGIKGVYDVSETNHEMPQYSYAYVQIVPFDQYDVELCELIEKDSVKMFGDRNWYNSNEIYTRNFKNGTVKFHITDKGHLEVINCKDYAGEDMDINYIEEYVPDLSPSFNFLNDLNNLEDAIDQVRDKYKDNEDIQKAIKEIVQLKREARK